MVSAPRILSLATALPEHPLPQQAMRAFAPQLFPNRPPEKLEPLLSSFDAAGIVARQICVPMEWLAQPHG